MSKNLVPGQYQIGKIVFGKHTPIKVSKFDPQAYNITAQDQQASRSDETVFGIDNFAAQPITLEMSILDNRALENVAAYTGLVLPDDLDLRGQKVLDALATEWRGDDVRNDWGSVKPLYYCSRDGITRVIYGRPRKFYASKRSEKSEAFTITAEYMRQDSLCYREQESAIEILKNDAPTALIRTEGKTPTWLRILGYGPITHPIITVGEQQIELDIEIGEDEAFEVSSYPWRRRAIDSNGLNINADLIGPTQYLDRLVLPSHRIIPIRWTSDEFNTFVPALGNRRWIETIDDINHFNLPQTFTTIAGRAVIRFDLFNPDWAETYIASGLIGTTTAVLYNKMQFATRDQYCEAKIVEPFWGKSGIVIMCNDTMTDYMMLEVMSQPGNNWLRLRDGTAYNNYSSIKAEWQNTDLWGWKETDVVGIGSEYDAGSGDVTYTAYFNGLPKCSWTDDTHLVNTSAANRNQGFIFDLDGGLFTVGTGFKDIVAYDKAVVPSPTGRIFLLWHDSWGAIF